MFSYVEPLWPKRSLRSMLYFHVCRMNENKYILQTWCRHILLLNGAPRSNKTCVYIYLNLLWSNHQPDNNQLCCHTNPLVTANCQKIKSAHMQPPSVPKQKKLYRYRNKVGRLSKSVTHVKWQHFYGKVTKIYIEYKLDSLFAYLFIINDQ